MTNHTDPSSCSRSPSLVIRRIQSDDIAWVREELIRNWGTVEISSIDRIYPADALPGFIALHHGDRAGLVTYNIEDEQCEVVTLSSRIENQGVGAALLAAAVEAARAARCARIFLTTTNDNLRALGFYQRRGWKLVAVHRGAMDRARLRNPAVPLIGMNRIPLRDEIELEIALRPAR